MQFAFGFYEEQPSRLRRPERLFFGIMPDAKASARIGTLRDRLIADYRLKGRPVETRRLHLSLHHVGDYRRLRGNFIYAAEQAGKAVSMYPFEVTLSTVQSFDAPQPRNSAAGRRPLVLLAEADAFFELHANLGRAMQTVGLKAGAHVTPHVTLFYGPKSVPTLPIEPLRFAVTHFDLIHSERGLNRYNVLARWPLRN